MDFGSKSGSSKYNTSNGATCSKLMTDNLNKNATTRESLVSHRNGDIVVEKSDDIELIIEGRESNDIIPYERNRGKELELKLNTDQSYQEMKCLFCSYSNVNVEALHEHVDRFHFNLISPCSLSPSKPGTSSFNCPLCPVVFRDANDLELHINSKHTDVLSPVKKSNKPEEEAELQNCCPVCKSYSSDSYEELSNHVERHFSEEQSNEGHPAEDTSEDYLLAQKILKEDEERLKKEELEFKQLQAEYGMNNQGSFEEQSVINMNRAVQSGKLGIADYYDMKTEFKVAKQTGIDAGHSCVKSIIPPIEIKSIASANVTNVYLCSNMDFYSSTYGDRGWGCGYRNLQMLLSSLFRNRNYIEKLSQQLNKFGIRKISSENFMPCVSKLQEMIEWAWEQGFDAQGQEQLGRKLRSTRKWIGATEIAAVLSSLRFRYQLIDIHRPSANGKHFKMLEWIVSYFKKLEPFKPPLYLQHQGHSRTIAGIEVLKNGEVLILILDPGIGSHKIEQLLSNVNPFSTLKLLRKTIHDFKADQYQVLTVVGVMDSEKEYQASKIIRSTKIS